jgi:hypothetical protein
LLLQMGGEGGNAYRTVQFLANQSAPGCASLVPASQNGGPGKRSGPA